MPFRFVLVWFCAFAFVFGGFWVFGFAGFLGFRFPFSGFWCLIAVGCAFTFGFFGFDVEFVFGGLQELT